MNDARRYLLAGYSLLLIAAAVGLAVLAWNSDRQLDVHSGSFRLVAHIDGNDTAKLGFTAIMAGVALAGVTTLLVAMTDSGGGRTARSGPRLRIRRPGGGFATIDGGELELRVQEGVQRLPEVQSAAVDFRTRGGLLQSEVNAMIDPGTSQRHVTNAISNTVVATLRDEVAMEGIAEPMIRLHEGPARAAAWPPPPPPTARPAEDDAGTPDYGWDRDD